MELDVYFDELMHVATRTDLEISTDTMHQYVVGLGALKTKMCMLSDELDSDARSVYPDAMKVRVCF